MLLAGCTKLWGSGVACATTRPTIHHQRTILGLPFLFDDAVLILVAGFTVTGTEPADSVGIGKHSIMAHLADGFVM